MTEAREFHISAVISAATGIHVAIEGVGAFYDLLGYMTNSTPMTHQLPRLADECGPSLRAQHPELIAEPIPPISSMDDVHAWLATLYPKYGETVPVHPLDPGDHTEINPIAELLMMKPDAQIIVVDTGMDER